jgi:hypothetical protein
MSAYRDAFRASIENPEGFWGPAAPSRPTWWNASRSGPSGRPGPARCASPAWSGTDVTYRLGVYPTVSEYGYTDTPGRWDHWPAAFVFTGGADDGVDGVLSPGDVLLPFNTYVQTPVTLTIEQASSPISAAASTPSCCRPTSKSIRRPPRLRNVARRLGRLWPPAMDFGSSPSSASRATAPATSRRGAATGEPNWFHDRPFATVRCRS